MNVKWLQLIEYWSPFPWWEYNLCIRYGNDEETDDNDGDRGLIWFFCFCCSSSNYQCLSLTKLSDGAVYAKLGEWIGHWGGSSHGTLSQNSVHSFISRFCHLKRGIPLFAGENKEIDDDNVCGDLQQAFPSSLGRDAQLLIREYRMHTAQTCAECMVV